MGWAWGWHGDDADADDGRGFGGESHANDSWDGFRGAYGPRYLLLSLCQVAVELRG